MFFVDNLIAENIHRYPLDREEVESIAHRRLAADNCGYGWQEIVFFHNRSTGRCHFLGVGAYWREENSSTETLFSSIFRSDPTEDLPCPWSDVYCFCETVLTSCGDRIFPPFVRLNHSDSLEPSNLYLLRNFNYQSMNWHHAVQSIATQERDNV